MTSAGEINEAGTFKIDLIVVKVFFGPPEWLVEPKNLLAAFGTL